MRKKIIVLTKRRIGNLWFELEKENDIKKALGDGSIKVGDMILSNNSLKIVKEKLILDLENIKEESE